MPIFSSYWFITPSCDSSELANDEQTSRDDILTEIVSSFFAHESVDDCVSPCCWCMQSINHNYHSLLHHHSLPHLDNARPRLTSLSHHHHENIWVKHQEKYLSLMMVLSVLSRKAWSWLPGICKHVTRITHIHHRILLTAVASGYEVLSARPYLNTDYSLV